MPEQALPLDVGDEPLIGWRCWHVLPHEGLLRPIYKRGLVWKPRQPLEAICPEEPHEVPADHCKCGVWTVCHPMLLDEVGWTKAPPAGTAKLPGVIVVGEVSLWGKIIQHERGWRASCAYPRHLYAFTEDAMLAETLRERYGVPVEWGANTERLRRMLPREANRDEGPSLRETLLDVLRTGLCPKPLEELAATALDELGDLLQPPEKRIEAARASLAKATTATERTKLGWRLAIAVADQRALKGNTTAARRALWMRLARWQRHRSDELFEKKVEWCLRERDGLLEDLARGSIAKGGATLASPTCRRRSRASGLGLRTSTGTSRPPSFPRSRRSRLCRSRAIGNGARSRRASWWARGGRSRKRARPSRRGCAEHSSENGPSPRSTASCAIRRHQLNVDTEALAREQAQLERDRQALRDTVVAGVQRDHAELLREVADLEAPTPRRPGNAPGPVASIQSAPPHGRGAASGHRWRRGHCGQPSRTRHHPAARR